jgi:anti-sigma28 factor (negative regulator of flagellin synthesis)
MQVNNNSLNLSAAIGQSSPIEQNKAGGANGSHSTTANSGDNVQLSSLASQLAADPSNLAQLQAAYESGTYSVSPAQVANSIINDAMQI